MSEQAATSGRPSPEQEPERTDEGVRPLPSGVVKAVVGIAEGLELSRILERLACAARDATGAQYAAIGVLGPDGLHQEFVHVGIPEDVAARIGPPPRGHGVLGHITSRRATVRVSDIGSHETSVGFPDHHPPMAAFLGVPLVVREKVFGNLYLANKPGGFSDVDAAAVELLAAATAVAVDNARLYRATRTRQAWAEAAVDVSTTLLSGAEPEEALQRVVAVARDVADADAAALALPSLDGALVVELDAEAGGRQHSLVGTVLAPSGNSTEVAGHGQGRLVADLRTQPELGVGELRGFGPALLAPFTGSDGDDGVLLLLRRPGGRPFDRDDLDTAAAFASQAALALRLAEARQRSDRLVLAEERARIARDLHDLAIQQLFAVGIQLDRLRDTEDTSGARTAVEEAMSGIETAVQHIRETIRALRPESSGLLERLRRECAAAAHLTGFTPSLSVEAEQLQLERLDRLDTGGHGSLADDVVAVVREALSNVARHAEAGRAEVRLTVSERELVLQVEDDGVGLAAGEGRRSGIANIIARARLRHGDATVTDHPGGGALVRWQAPLS